MMMLAIAALAALQAEGVTLAYPAEKGPKDKVSFESTLTLKIEGSGTLVNYIRSIHPLLSMEKAHLRADATNQATGKSRQKLEIEESRLKFRYDDEDHEFDFKKGTFPPGDKDKLKQMMFFLAAGGRNYTLTPAGEYKSDDAGQDHNGEAMDLMALAITRMPSKPVKEGDTYETTWRGQRADKRKDGKLKDSRYVFTQKVKVEKIEEKDGQKRATLTGDLAGEVQIAEGEKDPSAEEAWQKCEGKTKLVIEAGTGRVISSEGSGTCRAYFRGTAEDGSKNELKLTFTVEGKLTPR